LQSRSRPPSEPHSTPVRELAKVAWGYGYPRPPGSHALEHNNAAAAAAADDDDDDDDDDEEEINGKTVYKSLVIIALRLHKFQAFISKRSRPRYDL